MNLKTNSLGVAAVALMIVAAVTVWGSKSQQTPQKQIIPENYLPDGAGRDLILQACVQCHDLRNTVTQRKNTTAWKRTVDEMIWRGAPLMADETAIVTKYLVDSFGPDKPIPAELKNNSAGNKP